MDDEISSPDDDIIDNMSNLNNISGSYSNLFREKMDDEPMDGNRSTMKLLRQSTQSQNNSSTEIVENVYSNIPSQTLSHGHSAVEQSDPSHHVYSNIDTNEPEDAAAVVAIVVPPTSQSPTKPNPNEYSLKSSISSSSLLRGSSTLLSDDLDLDDPVLAAGSFAATSSKKKKSSKSSTTNKSTDGTASASASKANVSLEMKHVTASTNPAVNGAATNANNSSAQAGLNSSNAFISPSRMRLLHDTTMIDTALDLDSLDGSNLGNSSQACLVNKTAIM